MSEWIRAKDKLPQKEKDVLLAFGDQNMVVGFLSDNDGGTTYWCANTDCELYTYCDHAPTHWMSLPEVPEV